ncbi:MAG: hypothetical protein PHQ07_02005 [Candidatus ainarchaeum sp.]|nr:hypothetical protein [Candidatus ainarchaeum sp.]
MIKKIFGIFVIIISFLLIINVGYAHDVPFVIKITGDLNLSDTSQDIGIKAYVNVISNDNLVLDKTNLPYANFNSEIATGFFTAPISKDLTGTDKTFPLRIIVEVNNSSFPKTISISNPNYSSLEYYANNLVVNSLNNNKFADKSITTNKLKDNSVSESKINYVYGENLVDNAVTGSKIKNNTLTKSNFANEGLNYVDFKILNNNSGINYLSKNPDNSAFVAVGTIAAIDLMEAGAGILKTNPSEMNTFSIKDLGIVNSMIGNNEITTNKLNDGAIITSKLADDFITTNKFAEGAVENADLDIMETVDFANNSLTVKKLSEEALTALLCNSVDVFVYRSGPNTSLGVARTNHDCDVSFNGSEINVTYGNVRFENVTELDGGPFKLNGNEISGKAFCALHNGKFLSGDEVSDSVSNIAWVQSDNLWARGTTTEKYYSDITCVFDGVTKYSSGSSGNSGVE